MVDVLRQGGRGTSNRQIRANQKRPRPVRSDAGRGTRVFPSIIISAKEDALIVRAELAGVKKEDLNISISGDTLTIQGVRHPSKDLTGGWYHRRERETGEFSRAIQLPAAVDGEQAEASYSAGVLAVHVPLREAAKPRGIPVRVEEG